ncbi:hypothetical protein SUDANB150_03768 [Streptomyces sp. enrichment culture]|uniref:K(+)-transporting ATPase subunit F n=1 Tax=Streptomyces hyderabadensis TaxID=598549 RepID=A0ABP9I3Z8_9ACTN
MDTVRSGGRRTTPGALVAFARFVLCGGGVGLAAAFAVAGLAAWMPWALANALVTAASTLLGTELHARFTFGAGGRTTWRQHAQSAGSAGAAYAVTCAAMLVLHQVVAAPGAVLEQAVYLSASALAGIARFVVLRLVVFARGERRPAAADGARPLGCPPGRPLVRDVSKALTPPYGSRQRWPKPVGTGLSSSCQLLFRTSLGASDGRRGLRRHHDRGVRVRGPCRQGGDEAVTAENIVGLIVAVALLGYLVLALIHPERF